MGAYQGSHSLRLRKVQGRKAQRPYRPPLLHPHGRQRQARRHRQVTVLQAASPRQYAKDNHSPYAATHLRLLHRRHIQGQPLALHGRHHRRRPQTEIPALHPDPSLNEDGVSANHRYPSINNLLALSASFVLFTQSPPYGEVGWGLRGQPYLSPSCSPRQPSYCPS